MPSDHIKRYPCKIQLGRWFYAHLILSLCLYACFLISAWFFGSVLILVLALSLIAVRLAMFSMFTNLSYELDDMHLIVRSGLLRHRMLLSEVHEILPSKKPMKLLMIYSKFRQKMDIPSPGAREIHESWRATEVNVLILLRAETFNYRQSPTEKSSTTFPWHCFAYSLSRAYQKAQPALLEEYLKQRHAPLNLMHWFSGLTK